MCETAMQCELREYHAFDAEHTMPWPHDDEDGHALARAWLPEGMKWYEATDSLMLYDPTRSRWLRYETHAPRTDAMNAQDVKVAFDTLVVGTSATAHGGASGGLTFHGRVRRQDGQIALVRKPVDAPVIGLGTWVFHGQMHGGRTIVGDWRVTATSKYAPGRQGWFNLTREVQPFAK